MWSPVLDGSIADRAWCAIHKIIEEETRSLSLIVSPVELGEEALLFGCAWEAGLGEDLRELAVQCIDHATTKLSPLIPAALHGGLSGFGWIVNYLVPALNLQHSDLMDSEDDILSDLDNALYITLSEDNWIGKYDLIVGLAGIGLYFLSRTTQGRGRRGLLGVLDKLETLAITTDSGIAWWTPPELVPKRQRSMAPNGYFNLSMSHGISGVIGFLSRLISKRIEIPRSEHLLQEAIRWLLKQRVEDGEESLYPNWVPSNIDGRRSRIAWCYGDLGIGAALYGAGRHTDRQEWSETAHEILHQCSKRSPAGINTPFLCHGAIGIAHVFNRIYQKSGDATLLTAARSYYEMGLMLWETQTSVEEFSRSLLSGNIGVALGLLSAVCNDEPRWDERILLNLP